ncbi:hypothetical protein DTO164E3_8768 [Paecilomyces variotii]|nr:hypothetical protein DTO164E3_8768 [Paecilomyces variotii]KAJ9202327.1 hypothetical protein DTO032I3_3580 [Paecilomyces variotii]KAJ9278552.1 hypothetical protein DTO021D3_4461 [Paecilomyces variotii]KAJ9344526.1 hypothetical protein DTO027B6_2708 [Paecilomyces variotii]KAJ9350943.1 hypothetical protein DTO027B9_6688 [Paecilomyces variotii]
MSPISGDSLGVKEERLKDIGLSENLKERSEISEPAISWEASGYNAPSFLARPPARSQQKAPPLLSLSLLLLPFLILFNLLHHHPSLETFIKSARSKLYLDCPLLVKFIFSHNSIKMMSKMSSKIIVLFVLWALVVLGHGDKLPREVDALKGYVTSLEALDDNLNLHDADDAPYVAKFNQLFARAETVTTTVTVEVCSSAPGTTAQTSTTTATISEVTTSSAPVIPVPIPIQTSSISSGGYSSSGYAPIPPYSSVESTSTGTTSEQTASSSPAASSVPAATTSVVASSVSATKTSASSTYTHAPYPSGTAVSNGVPNGVPSAILGMAVAMIALVTL